MWIAHRKMSRAGWSGGAPPDFRGGKTMYGLIVKLKTVPGMRKELLRLLKESTADLPGCLSYIAAEDSVDEDTIWLTETWESEASHDASLLLPPVKNILSQARAIIAGAERIAATSPVWGVGTAPPIFSAAD
jgi:quinol monooxygenase YgiN